MYESIVLYGSRFKPCRVPRSYDTSYQLTFGQVMRYNRRLNPGRNSGADSLGDTRSTPIPPLLARQDTQNLYYPSVFRLRTQAHPHLVEEAN